MEVRLRSGRFFCDADDCVQRVFTERLPEIVATYAGRMLRLQQALRWLGLALGGAAGERCHVAAPSATDADRARSRSTVSVRSWPSGHRRRRTPCLLSGDDFDRVKNGPHPLIRCGIEANADGTAHNQQLCLMQSIFSLAARPTTRPWMERKSPGPRR